MAINPLYIGDKYKIHKKIVQWKKLIWALFLNYQDSRRFGKCLHQYNNMKFAITLVILNFLKQIHVYLKYLCKIQTNVKQKQK